MESLHPEPNENEFRELEKNPRWAGVVETDLDEVGLIDTLREHAKKLNFRFFGYSMEGQDGGLDYHFNRYPRAKYNPPPLEKMEEALAHLGEYGVGKIAAERVVDGEDKVKVLLALGEGYDSDVLHTPEEAEEYLGEEFSIDPCRIVVVGESPDNDFIADAVVIEGHKDGLGKIYELADAFKQHRFTVENIGENTINLVETRWCTEPD